VPQSGRIHDRELLDALEALSAKPFSGTAWRTSWATRDPLAGNTAGGRWHPDGSFEALYTSLEANGSLAEVYFHLSRAPVLSSAHVKLFRIQIRTQRTLSLDDTDVLSRLGIEDSGRPSPDHARSQEIGSAAHFLEFDSLLVPSTRWSCSNLVLFLDRLNPDEAFVVGPPEDVNWPAWKEEHRNS
jgi:RES domain-containing protein